VVAAEEEVEEGVGDEGGEIDEEVLE